MADPITVKNESSYTPVPEGQYQAVCVDVIDMGEKVETFPGKPASATRKVMLVFQVSEDDPDTGKPFEVSSEMTLSFGAKANLRKFLGNWRGKTYSDAEAALGVPLHKLEGVNAVLTIEHKTSAAGKQYAKINNITPVAKGMRPLKPRDYVRGEFWAKRKAEYAAAVAEFRKMAPPADAGRSVAEIAQEHDNADDLPF